MGKYAFQFVQHGYCILRSYKSSVIPNLCLATDGLMPFSTPAGSTKQDTQLGRIECKAAKACTYLDHPSNQAGGLLPVSANWAEDSSESFCDL